MKLLEHEGKEVLKRHGIPVPVGQMWPTVPESNCGWMVKAQVLVGGRGKRGGVVAVDDRSLLSSQVDATKRIDFGTPVLGVYIEERLSFSAEFYLAALVNRDRGIVEIVASAEGGVDIEEVPSDQIVRIRIDPLVGLAEYQLRELARHLNLQGSQADEFARMADRLYECLVAEDAELIEINPLVAVEDSLIAADCKMVLDDDAMDRHPNRPRPAAWETDGKFMSRCRELGTIGVDNRPHLPTDAGPTVAVLANGAGLTMATYDLVGQMGVAQAGAIELHGALAKGREHTANVFTALFELGADIVLVNAFYQLRSCDVLAQALGDALSRPGAPPSDRIVARMRGVDQTSSQNLVEELGCFYTASLDEAGKRVKELATTIMREKTK